MLNIMGISYAAWSEGTRLDCKVSTGNMELIFEHYEIEGLSKNINDELVIEDEFNISHGERGMKIGGRIIESGNRTLTLRVKNNGSVPVRLAQVDNGYLENGEIMLEPQSTKEIIINNITINAREESINNNNHDVKLTFEQLY